MRQERETGRPGRGHEVDGTPPQVRLEPVATLAAVRSDWTEVAKQTRNVFSTWEWASIWWRHFGGSRPLMLTACRSPSGRLVGILPLYRWSSRPLRIVRFLGHGPADQLGPVAAASDRVAIAAALRQALGERRTEWDLFLGDELLGDEGWSTLLGATTLRFETNPTLRLDDESWERFLAGRSRNLRQQVRSYERRLFREGNARYRLCDDASRFEEDLDTLFALHRARWRGERSLFIEQRAFHREFALCAFERGWARLWLLEVSGRPVAALYGFRFRDVEAYYQAGRDPAWDRASVGFVLLAHSIREALADGMREYRFLAGDQEYKQRFANTDPGLETIVLWRGAIGRAAVAAGLLSRRSRVLRTMLQPLRSAAVKERLDG